MEKVDRPVPMKCIVCAHRPESYYGRLVFPEELESGETPTCPNHKGPQDAQQPLVRA